MACSGLGSISAAQINNAATSIGIPCEVVRAQLNAESGGRLGLTSSANAQGPWQFEPGTWSSLGCPAGGMNDPVAATNCYIKYMQQLLRQFNGNVRNALAAYNAGPGNVPAGLGYADGILAASKNPASLTSSGGTGTSSNPAGISLNPFGGLSVSGVVNDIITTVLGALGLKTSLKDMAERFGLIILGFALVILGIHMLSQGGTSSPVQTSTNESATSDESGGVTYKRTTNRKVKSPVGTHTKTTSRSSKIAGEGVGAEDAMEAAAIA